MAVYRPPRRADDFGVAIICALKIEADAVKALFDQSWDDVGKYQKAPNDRNAYSIGRIGDHNVVVAHMPGMGNTASAVVAADMRSTFHNIRLALVVGICGGVPQISKTQEEILLGDVIISTGLIQIDFGRQFSDTLKRKTAPEDVLARPNIEIRSHLSKMAAQEEHAKLTQRTNEILTHLLETGVFSKDQTPSPSQDELFPSSYRHKHHEPGVCDICDACESRLDPVCDKALEASCSTLRCDKAVLLERKRLQNIAQNSPPDIHSSLTTHRVSEVYFGLGASGGQVIRSAWHRDEFAEKENVIAFEMEAAGVWDNLPTVVIKGVCDYADSHKNKTWQAYAAATAASCSKAFLKEWAATHSSKEPATLSVTQHDRRLWTIPRPVNPLFIGRDEIRDRIARAFHTQTNGGNGVPKNYVISGLGGTGKSEVCLKFAMEQKEKYEAVFWIDCGTEAAAQESFKRAGVLCNIQEPDIARVKDFLSNSNLRWLLILDNADDPEFDYSKYTPNLGIGNIIITTRNPDLAKTYATVGSEILDQLNLEHACELLLRTANIDCSDWPKKEKAAKAIVEELGRHTLAILHAGSFIEYSCRFEEYLDLYRKNKDKLFDFDRKQQTSEYRTVRATFEVSITRLRSLSAGGAVYATDALHLLNLLGFLGRECPLRLILTAASSYASEILKNGGKTYTSYLLRLYDFHAEQLPKYCPSEGENTDGHLRWRRASKTLTEFSLISISETAGNEVITVHPLVHSWIKHRLHQEARSAAWLSASSVLALSCDGRLAYIPIFEQLRRHVEACLSQEVKIYVKTIRHRGVLSILYQLCWVQYRLNDGEGVGEIVGILLQEINRVEREEKSVSKASKSKTLLKNYARRLVGKRLDLDIYEAARLNLYELRGMALQELGENSRALLDFQRLFEAYEKVYEVDGPTYLQTKLNAAYSVAALGEIEKGIKMLEEVVKMRERTLTKDDLGLAMCRRELAQAYLNGGYISNAIKVFEEVVSVQDKKLDEGHPDQLASQLELARAYLANRQVSDAIALFERVVNIQEKKLSQSHPDLLMTQHNLAGAYFDNEQVSDAILLFERVVTIREKELDETHPHRLASQYELARAYLDNEQVSDAITLFERVVSIHKKIQREEDKNRLVSEHSLAGTYARNGQMAEAIELLEHVVNVERRCLCETPNERLESLHSLRNCYEEAERSDQAAMIQEEIDEVERRGRNEVPSSRSKGAKGKDKKR